MAEVVIKDRRGDALMVQFIFSNYANENPKYLPRLRVNFHLERRYKGDATELSEYLPAYAKQALPTQFYVAMYKHRELLPLLASQKILRFVDSNTDMTYQLCEFVEEDLKKDAEDIMKPTPSLLKRKNPEVKTEVSQTKRFIGPKKSEPGIRSA